MIKQQLSNENYNKDNMIRQCKINYLDLTYLSFPNSFLKIIFFLNL